ncbi:hypothetical protein D3C81_1785590 [compost metagenome]
MIDLINDESEVENTFAMGFQETPLWSVTRWWGTELQLHIRQVGEPVVQLHKVLGIRYLEVSSEYRERWKLLPRANADRLIERCGLLHVIYDDAYMVELFKRCSSHYCLRV